MLYENRIVWFTLLHVGILAVICWLFGLQGLLFQLGYSVIGIFFIEMINYVEHYGLRRRKDARGIYEPITERHSWNSTSGPLLFRIQRHSDHHMHAYRPYQILRKLDQAPQLPFDYLFSLLLAMHPKSWFAAMDPLVEHYRGYNKRGAPQGQGGAAVVARKPNMQPAYSFFFTFYVVLTLLVLLNF